MDTEMMYKRFGERVRGQRVLAQLTQEKLSQLSGISLSFLGHIERGTRKASLDTVVKLANALKVSPNLLLQDSLEDGLLDFNTNVSPVQADMLREITHRIIQYGNYLEGCPEHITVADVESGALWKKDDAQKE